MFEPYLETLIQTALFKGIEKNQLLPMMECLRPKVCSYRRNDYITVAGTAFESVGIILKGEATVSKEDAAGNRVMMALLSSGELFGEMVAFSTQSVWPATVQAQEVCQVFFLPRGKIIEECTQMCLWHRRLIQNFLQIISERALLLNKRIEYLTIKSMRGKISSYLLDLYQRTGDVNLNLPLKRNELADFLNVSRPSMSRELCSMRDEGVIDFHLAAFRILDIEKLKAMSNTNKL